MKTRYEKPAIKALMKMQPKLAATIQAKIEDFAANGAKAHVDIKVLRGVANGYRLRQGSWRALMYVHGDELVVETIKPRGDAYK